MGRNLPSLDQLIDDYLLCCRTEGKSPRTIEWYSYNLGRFSRFLESQGLSQSARDIGRREVRRFIFHLENEVTRWETNPAISDAGRLSVLTIQGYARAIRAFWSWLLDEGYIVFHLVRPPYMRSPDRENLIITVCGDSILSQKSAVVFIGFDYGIGWQAVV